jgi:Amt family ammonium transporter
VNTHFAAATAALAWAAAEWLHRGKPSALGTISGAVAGLVAITPAAGFVQPMSALVIGAIAGAFCYLMVVKIKSWFGYDDSLDAFGVHGAGGTIGAILTGVFASSAINPIFKDAKTGAALPSGAIEGNWHQLLNQLMGIAIAWVISIIGTFVLLKLVDLTIGLRVKPEHEIEGLDITQHGEEGYEFAS